jgi:hypothetical protein
MSSRERVHELFLLNLCLQLFDGVATYQGLRFHWSEGNPLLLSWMALIGIGPTLLLFKAKACAFLVVLRRFAGQPFVHGAFVVLACIYTVFSFVPWMTRIVSLLCV